MSYSLTTNLLKLIRPGQKLLLNLRHVSRVYIDGCAVVFVTTEKTESSRFLRENKSICKKVVFTLPTVDEANRVFDDVEQNMK